MARVPGLAKSFYLFLHERSLRSTTEIYQAPYAAALRI